MKTARCHLQSISPYGQGRQYDKEEVPALSKESHADYEKRTWRNRMHVAADGEVFIPAPAFKNCIADCAKYLSISIPGKGKATYTKHFEAGVLVTEGMLLGIRAEDVQPTGLYLPSDGRRGGTTRVKKYMPTIPEWEGEVTFHILDDTVTEDVFKHVLSESGQFIGLGVFRPRNNGYWGRFKVVSVKWG